LLLKVPAKERALHLWLITESRWNKKLVSRGSPDTWDSLRPRLLMKERPSWLKGPRDSIAMTAKKWDREISAYFDLLFLSADSAADPAATLVEGR
jgi:hypothetical protein